MTLKLVFLRFRKTNMILRPKWMKRCYVNMTQKQELHVGLVLHVRCQTPRMLITARRAKLPVQLYNFFLSKFSYWIDSLNMTGPLWQRGVCLRHIRNIVWLLFWFREVLCRELEPVVFSKIRNKYYSHLLSWYDPRDACCWRFPRVYIRGPIYLSQCQLFESSLCQTTLVP